MDLSRQEYPGLLKTLSPTQTVGLVNDRVDYISKTNNAIADWLEVFQEQELGFGVCNADTSRNAEESRKLMSMGCESWRERD